MSTYIDHLMELIEAVGEQIRKRVCVFSHEESVLSIAQIRLLKTVYVHGPLSMAQIAQSLRITPASATSLVNRLVKQGWLTRIADENDRRKIYIQLSEKKQAHWRSHHQKERKRLAQYMSILNEKEQKQFIELLTKLSNQ